MTKNDLIAAAWADFLRFAIDDQQLRDAFSRDTGRKIFTAANRLDAMIDDAAAKDADDVMAFMVWATRTQWGWNDAPLSFREDAEKWELERERS